MVLIDPDLDWVIKTNSPTPLVVHSDRSMSNFRIDIRTPIVQSTNNRLLTANHWFTITPAFTTLLQIKCTTFRKLDLQSFVWESLCSNRISIHLMRESWEWRDWLRVCHMVQLLLIIELWQREKEREVVMKIVNEIMGVICSSSELTTY